MKALDQRSTFLSAKMNGNVENNARTLGRGPDERYTRDPQVLEDLAFFEARCRAAEARAEAKGPDISEDDDDVYEIFGCMRIKDEVRSVFLTDRERAALRARYLHLQTSGRSRESAHQEVYGPFYRLRANLRMKRLRCEHPADDFIGSYPYHELTRAQRASHSEARRSLQSALVIYRRLPSTNGCRSRAKRSAPTRRHGSRRSCTGRRGSDPGGDSDPPGLGPLRRLDTRKVAGETELNRHWPLRAGGRS